MIIQVERSGGLMGIPTTKEIDAKDLPSELITTVKKIMVNAKSFSMPLKSPPRGAADHFLYKILIQDGSNQSVIECNEYNIHDDLKSLVKYIERNSNEVK